ncbi:uncharacterized protein LOC136074553 [Hydra vulgaris]|uniref:Uncharacterized protein LOC136074553 n=1 Tax=Hydra vulgaris TaxID=6087 RepID=A0ABM4B2E1_HYDVU
MSPSRKRIKLSGSAFKKLKKQRLESDEKLQKVFAKWIKKAKIKQNNQRKKVLFFSRCDDEQLLQNNEVNQNAVTTNLLEFKFDDPPTWPKINDSLRCSLVEYGAKQDKREVYPTTSTSSENRHFSSSWFEKNLPNGEKTSKFADTSKGFSEWKQLNPRIPEHENSCEHRKCFTSWKEMAKNLRERRSLDKDIQNAIQTEKEK